MRFITGKIGTVYLTRDGSMGATPLRAQVEGLPEAKTPLVGNVTKAADGKPYRQVFDLQTRGREFAIVFENMPTAVFNSVVAAVNASIAANTTIRVIVTAESGALDWNCFPSGEWLTGIDKFTDGAIDAPKMAFIGVSAN